MATSLSAVGADLSVSVSFSVASELVDAAREAQIGDDELVAILVAVVVILSTAQRSVSKFLKWLASKLHSETGQRGVVEFSLLLLGIAQRIALSLTIQILALSVRANQPSRLVRILSLLSAVSLFIFFEVSTGGQRQ